MQDMCTIVGMTVVEMASQRVTARERAINTAYADITEVAGRLNRAHADLVAVTVRILAGELWGGEGIRSPEHWLALYAGLSRRGRETWSA